MQGMWVHQSSKHTSRRRAVTGPDIAHLPPMSSNNIVKGSRVGYRRAGAYCGMSMATLDDLREQAKQGKKGGRQGFSSHRYQTNHHTHGGGRGQAKGSGQTRNNLASELSLELQRQQEDSIGPTSGRTQVQGLNSPHPFPLWRFFVSPSLGRYFHDKDAD
jgi:hypothetical protein